MVCFAQIGWSVALWEHAPAVPDDECGPLAGGDGAVFPADPERDALAVEDDRGDVRVAGDPLHGFRGEDLPARGRGGRGTGFPLQRGGGEGDVQVRALPTTFGELPGAQHQSDGFAQGCGAALTG